MGLLADIEPPEPERDVRIAVLRKGIAIAVKLVGARFPPYEQVVGKEHERSSPSSGCARSTHFAAPS